MNQLLVFTFYIDRITSADNHHYSSLAQTFILIDQFFTGRKILLGDIKLKFSQK